MTPQPPAIALLYSLALFLSLPVVLHGANHNVLTAQEARAGWMLLFDGRTLSGWAPRGAIQWLVEDGTLAYKPGSGGGHLATTSQYSDFQLKVDFWVDDVANSGVFLRAPLTGEITATNSYEVNIFDAHDKWPTGSINEIGVAAAKLKTSGRWSTYDITARGDHLVIRLNGTTTVDVRDGQFDRGVIGLQNLKGEGMVRFRNIKLRPLSGNARSKAR